MARERKIPFNNLTSADELFLSQEERDDIKREKVFDVELDTLDPFPNHPFQVKEDTLMQETLESVSRVGILAPAIVREKDDGRYEIVSGHRRKHAAELLGLKTLPVIIRNLSDDEAVIHMTDTNLQREEILPSEKAFAYKMKLDALKRQGQRSDLTSSQVGTKLQGKRSLDIIGEAAGDSRNTVHRYIRLTELIPEILSKVDEGKIAISPAVELSYLTKEEQASLFDAMECESCTPSHAQAIKLKKFSQDGKLTPEVISSIMMEEKGNQVESFKIPKDSISRFFKPGTSKEKIEARIVKALDFLERAEKKREGMER